MWWVSVNNWSSSSLDFTIPPFLVILGIDSNFWPIRKWNQTKRLKFGPLRVFNAPFRAHSGPIGFHCNMGFKLCGKRDLVCHIPYVPYGYHYWDFLIRWRRESWTHLQKSSSCSMTLPGHKKVNSGFMFWKNDWKWLTRLYSSCSTLILIFFDIRMIRFRVETLQYFWWLGKLYSVILTGNASENICHMMNKPQLVIWLTEI